MFDFTGLILNTFGSDTLAVSLLLAGMWWVAGLVMIGALFMAKKKPITKKARGSPWPGSGACCHYRQR